VLRGLHRLRERAGRFRLRGSVGVSGAEAEADAAADEGAGVGPVVGADANVVSVVVSTSMGRSSPVEDCVFRAEAMRSARANWRTRAGIWIRHSTWRQARTGGPRKGKRATGRGHDTADEVRGVGP